MPPASDSAGEVTYAPLRSDELVRDAASYGESFEGGDLPLPPAKRVAVVACIDARLNPHRLLGLHEGDAHVIRNAGGVITDDEIRSLAISQRRLGTEEIMLIHHTDCGMLTFSDDDFRRQVQHETGVKRSGRPRRSTISRMTFANRSRGSRRVPHPKEGPGTRLRLRGRERTAA